MKNGLKRLLIVDDSEIDREILKNFLSDYFDLVEVPNGYTALQLIISGTVRIDAILLDLQMPILDGFGVMMHMEESGVTDIPVYLITAEATQDNIHTASQYKFLADFIKKPYEKDVILNRLGLAFDIPVPKTPPEEKKPEVHKNEKSSEELSKKDIAETNQYISKLSLLFNKYLANNRIGDRKFLRISDIMRVLSKKYGETHPEMGLTESHIDIIAQAAYFYNIGIMAVPPDIVKKHSRDAAEEEIYRCHSAVGANIVQLNSAPECRYFVRRCSDICMYHHELFANGLLKDENDIFPQLAAITIEFDSMILQRPDISEYQFDYVIKELEKKYDKALMRIKPVFVDCRNDIIAIYRR